MILQRRNQIVAWVQEAGAARVSELAERFQVSEVTIRNDLEELEKAGALIRDRGGALAPGKRRTLTALPAVEERARIRAEQKRRIAAAAAKRVQSGDTILLDAGTTAVEMAAFLGGIPGLTVVTNAVNVALEVAARTDARIVLLGGNFSRDAASTLGAIAEHTLAELRVPKVFLGTQAFDLENGLTDTTHEIAQIKRAMIRSAGRVYLLADSSKFGPVGFIKVAPIEAVHELISDTGLPDETAHALEHLGIRVERV